MFRLVTVAILVVVAACVIAGAFWTHDYRDAKLVAHGPAQTIRLCFKPGTLRPLDCDDPNAMPVEVKMPLRMRVDHVKPAWADPVTAGLGLLALLALAGAAGVIATGRRPLAGG